MDNNKVVLPRDVAEAIEKLREESDTNDFLIRAAYGMHGFENQVIYDFTSEDNFDVFLSALVNGYTIEQTPEEKVREYYESLDVKVRDSYEAEGVRNTLDLLGIKIEGINV